MNQIKSKIMRNEMKVNELRVGNIVSHNDYTTEFFEVVSIEKYKDSYVVNTNGGKNGTWINPISLITKVPITKDLLLKFGFWYNEETGIYQWGSYLQFGFNIKTFEFCYYTLDFSRTFITTTIVYAHELQNLCFELDKEQELKFQTKQEETNQLPY